MKIDRMHCLVTGGAGFIGSTLVEALLTQGHQVRVLDNLSTGNLSNLKAHLDEIDFLQGDIRCVETTKQACQGIDIVFHEAAIASVSQSMQNPNDTHATNVLGTLNLLEAAGHHDVKHFIFASTAAVYGYPTEQACQESDTLAPLSRYGLSKLLGEQACQFYSTLFPMQVTCLRYFNVFGPRQSPRSDYAGVIRLFAEALAQQNPVTLYGDGKQTRDFIHVTDIAKANMLALAKTGQKTDSEREESRFEAINIGSGQRYSILEILDHLAQILAVAPKIQHQPERRGEIRHSLAEITKAQHVLGFTPQISLRQGLEAFFEK